MHTIKVEQRDMRQVISALSPNTRHQQQRSKTEQKKKTFLILVFSGAAKMQQSLANKCFFAKPVLQLPDKQF